MRGVEIPLRDKVQERGAEDVKVVALLGHAADVRRDHGRGHVGEEQERPFPWMKRVLRCRRSRTPWRARHGRAGVARSWPGRGCYGEDGVRSRMIESSCRWLRWMRANASRWPLLIGPCTPSSSSSV